MPAALPTATWERLPAELCAPPRVLRFCPAKELSSGARFSGTKQTL